MRSVSDQHGILIGKAIQEITDSILRFLLESPVRTGSYTVRLIAVIARQDGLLCGIWSYLLEPVLTGEANKGHFGAVEKLLQD